MKKKTLNLIQQRRTFLSRLTLLSLGGLTLQACSNLFESKDKTMNANNHRAPNLFIGHGSPMNAIEKNKFSDAQKNLLSHSPKPNAIIVISAHWLTDKSTQLVASKKLKIIYDFYGFPQELSTYQYNPPGNPELAHETHQLLKEKKYAAETTDEWGLDHGAWSVLTHLYPNADVPVFQMSINTKLNFQEHVFLAKELKDLRSKNIMILSSGNLVHNLGMLKGENPESPHDFAYEFDQWIEKNLIEKNSRALCTFEGLSSLTVNNAHPTLEHYAPILYTLGACFDDESFSFPITGFQEKAISMRSVLSVKK